MLEIDRPSGNTENHSSKKRKTGEKVVVTVKIQESDKKQKQQRNEGPPSDCWSWRKYGQKPIKGSPYPRGYYRCSTSKGCSAKKQVERSKTDASILIITYTSTHSHPGPMEQEQLRKENSPLPLPLPNDDDDDDTQQTTTPKQEEGVQVALPHSTAEEVEIEEDHFQYSQSPFKSTTDHHHIIVNQEDHFFQENMEAAHSHVLYNEDPKSLSSSFIQDPMDLPSVLHQEEYDFYDELEELPTSSFFTAFMRSSFGEERVIANPS